MVTDIIDLILNTLSGTGAPQLITSFVVLSLGIFTVFRERFTKASITFSFFIVTIFIWLFAQSMHIASSTESEALLWIKTGYLGVVFIPASMLFMVSGIFRFRGWWTVVKYTSLVSSILFLHLAVNTDIFIRGVYRYGWGFYPAYGRAGIAFLVYFFSAMFFVLIQLLLFYRKTKRESSMKKRTGLFLLALATGYTGSVDYLQTFGVDLYPLGFLSALITSMILAWVIARYRLADIPFRIAARRIFEDLRDAVFVFDTEGLVRIANRAAETLFNDGRRIVERHLSDIIRDRNFLEILEGLPSGNDDGDIESAFVRNDGEVMTLSVSYTVIRGRPGGTVALICIARDVTEHKRLEAQLLQAQKMEAVGQLAGGVAHDFNNILTAIMGYGNLALMQVDENDPVRSYIKQILSASERAADLTQGLLAFSRKQLIDLRPVSLNDIVRNSEKLLKRIIGEDIELKTSCSDDRLTVMADRNQIEQVLINLATNARDAMPNGGLLTIETELTEIRREFIRTHGYGKEGKHALLTVSDSGTGMDNEILEKIFEPFFTTKDVGEGTGLGLSIAYGIVKRHNGFINVYSEPGKGTTFKIYLPIVKAEARKIEKEVQQPVTGGSETILIAEDEEDVRKLNRKILEEYGYKVIEAKDGMDAIEQFKRNSEMIDLMIVDVVMPKKSDKDVYIEAKRIKPDLKVIFTSGYTANVIHKKGILEEDLNFISKPLLPDQLLRKVREALDRG